MYIINIGTNFFPLKIYTRLAFLMHHIKVNIKGNISEGRVCRRNSITSVVPELNTSVCRSKRNHTALLKDNGEYHILRLEKK
jgi:peroxiredoxin